eukprot:199817_1
MVSSLSINLKLVSLIETATCIQDLIPLLTNIFGLAEVKDIMKQRVSTMNIQQKRDLHLKVSPMDDVLPECIVQHVMGFNDDLRQIALVNKTFHQCCDSVQRLVLRQKRTEWQTEFNDLHSDFKNNRIINVYPSTHQNTLPLAMEHAQSGDTLLIHQGVYQFQEPYVLKKNLKLIGYCPDVLINSQEDHDNCAFDTSPFACIAIDTQYAYLQNITFDTIDHFAIVPMNIKEKCSFYMENCVIESDWIALRIDGGKTVKIKDCIIKGGSSNIMGFFVVRAPEIFEIESCVFENCACNAIGSDDHCISITQSTKQAKFKCVANHFKNNWGFPIAAEDPSEINMEHAQIMNNTCICDQDRDRDVLYSEANPNKIYSYDMSQ